MSEDRTERVLRFDSSLTLPAAEAIRASLLAALRSEARVVEVDALPTAEVDLSFIQIVLAARCTASAVGKAVTLSAAAAQAVAGAWERGGFVGSITHGGSAAP